MYEMSTGRLPFDDESPISVVLMHMHDKPLPPRRINPKIPRGLEQLILCAMEKNPQKRYQSAADMLRELRRIKKNPSASVLTPARIAALKRSNRNRAENKPSRYLGIYAARGQRLVVHMHKHDRNWTFIVKGQPAR